MTAVYGKLERLIGLKPAKPKGAAPEEIRKFGAREDVRALYCAYMGHPHTRKNALVYFISCGGNRIKIGYSFNPEKRMRDIQTGLPFRLTLLGYVPGCVVLEKMLHERFASKRVSGEWFKATKSLMRDVDALIDGHGTRVGSDGPQR